MRENYDNVSDGNSGGGSSRDDYDKEQQRRRLSKLSKFPGTTKFTLLAFFGFTKQLKSLFYNNETFLFWPGAVLSNRTLLALRKRDEPKYSHNKRTHIHTTARRPSTMY